MSGKSRATAIAEALAEVAAGGVVLARVRDAAANPEATVTLTSQECSFLIALIRPLVSRPEETE